MKKILFFVAATMAAISMNAQAVYDWTNSVGKTMMFGTTVKETVKVHGTATDCMSLKNGFKDNNGVKIAPASGSFLEGDIVNVEFCINNSDQSKTGVLGIYAADSTKLTYGAANNTNVSTVDPAVLQYALTANADTLLLGRDGGNTKVCIIKLEVVRGGEIIPVAAKPVFSVSGGTYFEPFKVGLESSSADKIFVSVNNGVFEEYSDSIMIDQYDKDYTLSAFATLAGAEKNSDTAMVTYKLKHFVARPVFKARKEYLFAGITSDQINIQSPATASLSTYKLDGQDVPSINYKHLTHEDRDSFMIINVKDKGDVTFRYKNQNDKKDIMKFAGDYIQCDGSNFEIWVENVQAGDTIVFVVTAKGSAPQFDVNYSSSCYLDAYQPDDDTDPCYTDGIVLTASDAKIEDNYSGWQDLVYTVQSGRSRVRIKEIKNGFRIAKILVGAYRGEEHAVDNVNANVKAFKTIENGQLVIIKNGVRFNALGVKF